MRYQLTLSATRVRFRGIGRQVRDFAHEGWTVDGVDALIESDRREYATLAAARGQRTKFLREWARGREISPCGRSILRNYPDGSTTIHAVVRGREIGYGHRDHYALMATIAPVTD